jgi:hypothetical protein
MRHRAPLMLAVAAAMLVAAGPPARQADIDRIVFELCPQILDGSLSLDDPARAAAIGFTPTPPRQTPGGPIPRAKSGSGTATIILSGHKVERGPICSVWFGGPDNGRLLKGVRKKARSVGFSGGKPVSLGDGTPIQALRRGSLLLTVIEGNAGGELDFDPATTLILMPSRGD